MAEPCIVRIAGGLWMRNAEMNLRSSAQLLSSEGWT